MEFWEFSEELIEMDRNTVYLMLDELQEQFTGVRKEFEEERGRLLEKIRVIDEKIEKCDKNKKTIVELKLFMEEKEEERRIRNNPMNEL